MKIFPSLVGLSKEIMDPKVFPIEKNLLPQRSQSEDEMKSLYEIADVVMLLRRKILGSASFDDIGPLSSQYASIAVAALEQAENNFRLSAMFRARGD